LTEPAEQPCGTAIDTPLPVIEEPLDPANQSLADALRLSFRVLKIVMICLVIIFLLSGVVIVDEKEVVVLARFGRQVATLKPGLRVALPYPIHEQIHVSTAQKRLSVDTFWLRIRDKDKAKDLSNLDARGTALDPAVDGALLTGDRAIMHLLFTAEYRIISATNYVTNVGDEEREQDLLRVVLQNAAVAEAARATADLVWKDARTLASHIKTRAQRRLDVLESGIMLDDVIADKSYFPLQTKRQFLGVSNAENRKRELINEADSERTKKLLGVAGAAWVDLSNQIDRLDQVADGPERDAVIREIEDILLNRAAGEAGRKIALARRDRAKIISDAKAEARRFEAVLEAYRRNPELVYKRLRQQMRNKIFQASGVVKWLLPAGDKNIVLWLGLDPAQIRQAHRERIEQKTQR